MNLRLETAPPPEEPTSGHLLPVVRHVMDQASAPDARFADLVTLILLTSQPNPAASPEAADFFRLVVAFGRFLDETGLTPAQAERAALHAWAARLAVAIGVRDGSLKALADLFFAAAAQKTGALQ